MPRTSISVYSYRFQVSRDDQDVFTIHEAGGLAPNIVITLCRDEAERLHAELGFALYPYKFETDRETTKSCLECAEELEHGPKSMQEA